MTTGDQEERAEKRRVMLQDADVRQQQKTSTFHQHAQAQADEISQGRFAATGVPRVIGSTSTPAAQYPAASAAHQTELPPEQPLGYRVDEMPEFESPAGVPVSPPVATDDPAHAPSGGSGPAPYGGLVSERAGSSPLPKDQTNE